MNNDDAPNANNIKHIPEIPLLFAGHQLGIVIAHFPSNSCFAPRSPQSVLSTQPPPLSSVTVTSPPEGHLQLSVGDASGIASALHCGISPHSVLRFSNRGAIN